MLGVSGLASLAWSGSHSGSIRPIWRDNGVYSHCALHTPTPGIKGSGFTGERIMSEKHDYEPADAGSHECVYVCNKCGDERTWYFHHQNLPWPVFCEPKQGVIESGIIPILSFQDKVKLWVIKCFGEKIASDTIERNHRFLEESLELVQACGCSADEAHQLVDYVFGRPVGEKHQEAGGVMVTLAALCSAQSLDMNESGDIELSRIWGKIEQIRIKQAAKPQYGPLP